MKLKHANLFALICSVVVLSLGVAVIAGWYAGNSALIQINPAFAPMQYNTALGFLLCGIGILLLVLDKHSWSKIPGLILIFIGAVTLLQYFLNTNFGIDELLMDHSITTKTSHPGRMAPNTALLFALSGLALFLGGIKREMTISLAVAILVLSLISLLGYLVNEESIYGWGRLTRMAIHTACGFVVVSSGFIFYSVSGDSKTGYGLMRFAPLSVTTVVVIATILASYSVRELTQARNAQYFNTIVMNTQAALHNRFSLYKQSLLGGLALYYASDSVELDEWKTYVKAVDVQKTLPGINGLGYIDNVKSNELNEFLRSVREDGNPEFINYPETTFADKFIIRFIEPVERNYQAVGLDIGFEENRRTAAERARDLGAPALTNRIELVQDEKMQSGFLLLVPVYDIKDTPLTLEDRRRHIQGWVYAPFIGAAFLADLGVVSNNQLHFEVYDGDELSPDTWIFSSNNTSAETVVQPMFSARTQLETAGRIWTVLWQDSEQFNPPANQNLGLIIAIFGTFMALFLYIMLSRLIRSKELIARQVTERTAELKEALDFQDLVTNCIPDLIFVKDSEYRIVQANEAFLSTYPAEIRHDVIGSTTLENYDEEEAREFLRFDIEALEKGFSETEETVTFPDGRQRTLITRKTRFVNANQERFILGVSHDISGIREAENQILEANQELKRSNDELERFAYIASHDLQAPLRRIGGFIKQLDKHLAGQLDDRARNFMSFITDGVEQMSELIQGLLLYSRITIDEIKTQELHTNEIVALAQSSLSENIIENDAFVQCQDLPDVRYDKVMLTQLFQNLIGNAIRYRSEASPVIKISASKLDDYWEFAVKDNGIGIEEKYLDKIFEMFQRLHSNDKIAGTGIGLSLCQKIVERYGGKIRVISKPGEGSTFYFTVPIGRISQAA